MLRLKDFEIHNMGRHEHIKHTVRGDVLGLSGVSGIGKSTILQALELLVRGSIDHPDPLGAFIRRSELDPPNFMQVKGTYEADGKQLKVTRRTTLAGSTTHQVEWEGKKISSASAVAKIMDEVIGANGKALGAIVFVKQGSFTQIFSGSDADRRDFYVRLLMLLHLEKIAQITDNRRKALAGSMTDLSATKDAMVEAYERALEIYEDADAETQRTRDFTADISLAIELSGLLDQRAESADRASKELLALQTECTAAGISVSEAAATVERNRTTLAKLREDLRIWGAHRTNRRTYEQAIAGYESYLTAAAAWGEKSVKLASLRQELTDCQAAAGRPDPRLELGEITKARQQHAEFAFVTEQLSKLTADIAQAVTNEEAATVTRDADRKAANENREALNKAKSTETSSKKLLDELAAAAQSACCAACGSNQPDPAFLRNTLVLAQNEVTRLGALQAGLDDALSRSEEILRGNTRVLTDLRSSERRAANRRTELAAFETIDEATLGAREKELQTELPVWDAAKSLHARLTGEVALLAPAVDAVSYPEADIAATQGHLAAAKQTLEGIPTAEAIAAEEQLITTEGEALRGKTDNLERLLDNHRKAAEDDTRIATRIAETSTKISTEPEHLVLANKLTALGAVTKESLSQVLAEMRERQTEFDTAKGHLRSAKASLDSASEQLQEIELRIEEQKTRVKIVEELTQIRTAFQPSGITADYLTYQFRRIAQATQDHLAEMQADFMVAASEELPLAFDFIRLNEPNASWLGQSRMSGGQRVKLAVAILLAIHELVIPHVGMLVLDEPSTHLDADSRLALAEVLRDIGRRGNFQLIVCDHSPELKNAYTDTIELQS